MIRLLLSLILSAAVMASCAMWFQRAGAERRERATGDPGQMPRFVESVPAFARLWVLRDRVQPIGAQVLAVVIGFWFVLVAISSIATFIQGG